jgi:hypothetical protein
MKEIERPPPVLVPSLLHQSGCLVDPFAVFSSTKMEARSAK